MNFSKPKTGSSQPVIRKSVVKVPVPKAAHAAPHRGPDPNRFKQALDRKPAKPVASRAPQNPARRALSSSRGVKRKSATPQPALFSDDEDESSDIGGSDSDVSRKRIKSSVSSVESSGPRRPVVSEKAFKDDTVFDIIHGADATSGGHSHKFKNPWTDENFSTTQLQYPSRSQKERFELKWPKNESEDYKPMTDIIETVKTICLFYFPEELSNKYLDDDTGFGRRFNRAWHSKSTEEIIEVVQDFNTVVKSLVDDGTIRKELIKKSHLSLEWVKRILEQIYSRTVSPKVETLRAYQNGSDNVYGELLPRFCSEIFRRANLNHEQVFVDLGSGVGNVVLQAALEVGCESWGIEMMKNPCDLAELQAKEFPARTRLWGLSAGEVNLLRGDFTENTRIGEVLKRADVVLVNNQAFTPALNDKLLSIFLDLKDGCQVVSLKPFVPVGHKIAMRNYGSHANLFVQRRFEYFSESVSWTDQSGDYYIATKDPRPLAAFMKHNNLK